MREFLLGFAILLVHLRHRPRELGHLRAAFVETVLQLLLAAGTLCDDVGPLLGVARLLVPGLLVLLALDAEKLFEMVDALEERFLRAAGHVGVQDVIVLVDATHRGRRRRGRHERRDNSTEIGP